MGVNPHALYSRLLDDLSDQMEPASFERMKSGDLFWPEMTYHECACVQAYNSLLKKFEGGMNDVTKARALEKFLKVNSDCGNWSLPIDGLYGDDYLLGEFKQLIWRFWNPDNVYPLVDSDYDVLFQGRLGPGSSIDAKGQDLYTKLFSSSLSGTSRPLVTFYKHYIRNFPEWSNAESIRQENYGSAHIVEGNRLDFVPKNDDESRSICVEPVLNMFYQLGFGTILTKRLKAAWGIDLECQQFLNRRLARDGSVDESFVTIDLSSASDSISLRMLRTLLPSDFVRFLERYRCPKSRLPNGKWLELNMVSTMGNGFTFPLQTILFTAVVLAAFRTSGFAPIRPTRNSPGNYGINGDDIVVPRIIHSKVLRLLHLLGFRVNNAKTFVEGPFKESCGGDYFQGRNLRGPYLKRLGSTQETYVAINQLNLFSARTGVRLRSCLKYLLARVEFLPVPRFESDDAGIRVPSSFLDKRLWDKDKQQYYYYAWKPQSRFIIVRENSLVIPRGLKRRIFNPSGLHIALLQGSVNSSKIGVREDFKLYKRKRLLVPNWDAEATVHPLAKEEWFGGQRWETAVYFNIMK